MDRPLAAEAPNPVPDEDTGCWLYRLVQLPDGTYEDRDTPLQPEEFLDPRVTDRIVQGTFHFRVRWLINELVTSRIAGEPDSCQFSDQKLLWGIPGLPEPTPDLFLVRGAGGPEKFWHAHTYDVVAEGILPCLIVEVAISWAEKLWRADHVDKLEIYRRAGVPEYLIVDLPGALTNDRFVVTGYGLDDTGSRYELIEPDSKGRVFCKAIHVLFGVAPDGDNLEFFEGSTGDFLMAGPHRRHLADSDKRMETLLEIQDRAAREMEARREAEAKIDRLRRETARLQLLCALQKCLSKRLEEQDVAEEEIQEDFDAY